MAPKVPVVFHLMIVFSEVMFWKIAGNIVAVAHLTNSDGFVEDASIFLLANEMYCICQFINDIFLNLAIVCLLQYMCIHKVCVGSISFNRWCKMKPPAGTFLIKTDIR